MITIEIDNSFMISRAVYDPDAETLTVINIAKTKETTFWPVTLEQFGEFQKADEKQFFYLNHIDGGNWITRTVRRLKPEVEID